MMDVVGKMWFVRTYKKGMGTGLTPWLVFCIYRYRVDGLVVMEKRR